MTAADAGAQSVTIGPRVSRERGLSRIQEQIWTSQRLHRQAPLANMAKLHRIAGALDPDRLIAAFDTVVTGSDALRSVVVDRPGGEAIVRVLAAPPLATSVIDLPADEVEVWATARIGTPVDPTVCSYDSVLLRHGDAQWTWWLDLHHLVTDAWGASEVYRVAGEHYGALAAGAALPEPGPSFYDYVDTAAARFARGRAERTAHWAALTIDETPVAPFGPRAAATTHVERLPVTIDPRDRNGAGGAVPHAQPRAEPHRRAGECAGRRAPPTRRAPHLHLRGSAPPSLGSGRPAGDRPVDGALPADGRDG